MLQIQFLDRNVVNALVPAFSLEPGHLVFFYDGRTVSEKFRNNIRSAIEARLPETSVGFVKADMYSLRDIREHLLACVEDFREETVCLDITGGPELMTACALRLCEEHGFRIVYTNLAKGCLYDVLTEEKTADIRHITIEDYLWAIGAKQYSRSHTLPQEEEYGRICRTAEYLFDNLSEWHALHKYLSDHYAGSSVLDFQIPASLLYNGRIYNSAKALEIFVQNGFVIRRDACRYSFADEHIREYMMVYGVWLEMYIYIKAKEWFDEAHLGFVIDWNDSDLEDTVNNEIDVLVLRRSMPVFISCKMRKPTASDIYEVAYLADRLGGPDAKGIIATTYEVSADKKISEGIWQRLKKMHVGCIETASFRTHTDSQVFNTAMQGAE